MSASKAQRAKTAQRRESAIDLHLAGVNWQGIADRLDYASRGAAHTDVTRALEERQAQTAAKVDDLRFTECQRLDRLQLAFWGKALKGDARAAKIILDVMKQRARYTGTEQPTRVSVNAQALGDEILALLSDGDDTDGGDSTEDGTP